MQNHYILRLFIVALFFITSCASTPKQNSKNQHAKELNALVENYFEEYLKLYPLFATSIGDYRFDDQLTIPITKEHVQKELKLNRETLATIQSWGCESFTDQDRLTCEVFVRDTITANERLESELERLMPFNQWDSFFADFAELSSGSSYVSFNHAKDYRNFMKRMEKVPAYLDAMIVNMKEGLRKNITAPQVLVDKGLKQLSALTSVSVEKSVFYKPLLNLSKVASEKEVAEIQPQYAALIKEKIYPAYQKLEKFVRKEYRPRARKTHGISALPGGKKYYQALARYHTTTDLTPDQIMSLGYQEVSRIRKEFDDVQAQLKVPGTLKDFFKAMKKRNAKLYPFKTEEEVLNGYRAIQAKLNAQIPNHFRLLPKAKFEVKEVEKFKAENASEAYQNASADGSRPAVFWVPIPKPTEYGAKDMESLFLHEAIPGHHFQISIQQELENLPRFRRFGGNNAYVEGWALYTESLGQELGLYTDPYQWVGRLSGEMHRAVRLVVDTGIHWKGWTREKAIQFSKENEPSDEASIVSEIERYMAMPGQALSYKLGELKIQQLKRHAREVLGLRYDDRDFHDEILKDGALPLAVLEEKIDRWIESKKQ